MPHNNKPKINRPVALALAGMVIALGVFVTLLIIDFTWLDLVWCVPALALAAALVFIGARKR